jgi:hypothetical protein
MRDIKTKCSHPVRINFDTRIVKDSIGMFYIIMLKPLESLRTKKEDIYKNVIAHDPVVRAFFTGFNAEGNAFMFGKYGMNALQRNLLRAVSIQSSINQ